MIFTLNGLLVQNWHGQILNGMLIREIGLTWQWIGSAKPDLVRSVKRPTQQQQQLKWAVVRCLMLGPQEFL